jgi:hypothetical protein
MTHKALASRLQVWIVTRMREGTAARPPAWGFDRRNRTDRRHRVFWSVLYGSFNPRRRRPARRLGDARFHPIDWYSAHLLAVSIGILLLSATDAFLTGILLVHGADEVNPIMAVLVYRSVAAFAAFKMAMTGISIVGLVFLSRYRFMRVLRVDLVLYVVLLVYFWLIGYEIWMLHGSSDLPVL